MDRSDVVMDRSDDVACSLLCIKGEILMRFNGPLLLVLTQNKLISAHLTKWNEKFVKIEKPWMIY